MCSGSPQLKNFKSSVKISHIATANSNLTGNKGTARVQSLKIEHIHLTLANAWNTGLNLKVYLSAISYYSACRIIYLLIFYN